MFNRTQIQAESQLIAQPSSSYTVGEFHDESAAGRERNRHENVLITLMFKWNLENEAFES